MLLKLLCAIFVIGLTANSSVQGSTTTRLLVKVPISEKDLTCYAESIHLAWKGVAGFWQLEGEPGFYNGLWERDWGIEGERSCDQIPFLLELAEFNNGYIEGALMVKQSSKVVCYTVYGDSFCRPEIIETARLELPFSINLYKSKLFVTNKS